MTNAAIVNNVADLNFSQAERRNFVLPIAIAVLLLIGAGALLHHYAPIKSPAISVTHTAVWQAHTVYKSDSIVVSKDKAQDDLYVLTTLRIDDPLKFPLFLKDFTATLTTADGQTMDTSAAEKPDLQALYETFPAVKALASPPLLREATVAPGKSAEGMVLVHYPITEDAWNHRQSATLTVAFYHQPPQTITIPKP